MPKPSWLTITPASGNGNESVQISATQHTGTQVRSYSATVTNSKTEDCFVEVSQKSIAEFVNIQTTASPGKEASTLVITGTSNSSKLTFSWKSSPAPTLVVSLPETYTAAGSSTTNGAAITGDPGAQAQYDFSIELTIPENTTVEALTATLVVTTAGNQTAQCVITQTAGNPYLWVGAEGSTTASISLEATGEAKTLQIYSNDSWTIQ